MIKARADENQSSALKICVAVSKEKGFGNCFPKPNLVRVFITKLLKNTLLYGIQNIF